MIPEALPMLKPFREAVDVQLARVPKTRAEVDQLDLESRMRAIYATGFTRRAIVEELHGLAVKHIADGLTKSEMMEAVGELADKHGGVILSPQHLAVIAQNNFAAAVSSGRLKQLMHPDVLKERMFWQYPLGPNDARTSEICRKLQGLVARYDDPIWQHVYPENHHGGRHLKVLSLTEAEAKASGKLYASAGGKTYPVIDGQEILPDPGFDTRPALTGFDEKHLVSRAGAIGDDAPGGKSPADYKLGALAKMTPAKAPAIGTGIADAADAGEYDDALVRFRKAVGWPRNAPATILTDTLGEGVIVNERTFDHMLGLAGGADREQRAGMAAYFDLIRPLLEDPAEVWMVERKRGGVSVFTKRFFASFKPKGAKRVISGFVEVSPEGWLMDVRFGNDWEDLEGLRTGWLAHTRGGLA